MGGGGGTPEFKWRGWSNDFGGRFEIFDSGILFWVGKFGKYFFGWLDLRRDLLDIQNNLRIHGIVVVPAYLGCLFLLCVISSTALWEFWRFGNSSWYFFGVSFWSRNFFGFCLKPTGFFWISSFALIRSFPWLEIRSTPPPRFNRYFHSVVIFFSSLHLK